MSIELLLVIAFILLPLIQQLLRAAAQRGAQGESQQPEGPPPRPRPRPPVMRGPTPPSRVALPPVAFVPPAVPGMSPAASTAAPSRTASRSVPEAVVRGSSAHRRARRRDMLGRDLGPHRLRDAIVLMTILGPCRALAGDDAGRPLAG